MSQCVDKVEVRRFVEDCGLEHILTKQYAVYNTVSDVNFDMLPLSFEIKLVSMQEGMHCKILTIKYG